jgi:hypothetical protein
VHTFALNGMANSSRQRTILQDVGIQLQGHHAQSAEGLLNVVTAVAIGSLSAIPSTWCSVNEEP